MQAQQLPRCSGPTAAATSAPWRGAPGHRTPPFPLPQAPTYPAGLLRERIWLLRIPCVLPPPAPTGDSSSGCPPSPARPLPPWLHPGHGGSRSSRSGLCLPRKSRPTYLSSPLRSAPTPGKQTRMENHSAARRRCPQPGAIPAGERVAKADFLAIGN